MWTDFEVHYKDLTVALSFPENTEIPVGSYTYFKAEGGFDMPDGKLLSSDSTDSRENFSTAGASIWLGLEPAWNAFRYLELNGEYEVNIVRFPDRDQGFDTHVIRLRTQAAFNTRVSLNTFVQSNSADDRVSTKIRFRSNFREGNDLWFVLQYENLNTDNIAIAAHQRPHAFAKIYVYF
ncbi:hypothetical protein GWO43_00955 [candidate division KSB1 bacterium]|nr:hypothetical protein [candidate division KSB1 bacterium]NIV68546.1 hypothetical protein [Phycisphaerae bacterium]NIT69490.1 hypothetical protein [candidate division KSB1 bacterium]NIU23143.1 hypothetical protein [candidate division KSB1 bacterium]NIU90105.1 hypothetical protein [candidate division KSB1 bacterium]